MNSRDRKYLDGLAKAHQKIMVQLAYRQTCDRQLAKDLVQRTFLLACCKMDILRSHENPAGWLFNTLKNLTEHELRRQYHSAEVPLEDDKLSADGSFELPVENYLPKELSEEERELLLWRIRDGLLLREIAERLGIKEAACRKQMSRLIQKCRRLLVEEHKTV